MEYPIEALKWLLSNEVQDGFYNEPSEDKKELVFFLKSIRYGTYTEDIDPEYLIEVKQILKSVVDATDLPDCKDENVQKYMTELINFALN